MKKNLIALILGCGLASATTIVDPSLASSQQNNVTTPALQQEQAIVPPTAASADALGIMVDVNVGTQGVGLSLGYEFNEYFKMRLRGAYLGYTHEDTWTDVDGEFEFNGSNAGIIFDYHPFGGVFRISAGLNFSELSLDATGSMDNLGQFTGEYEFGGKEYQVTGDKASVKAEYEWNKVQPYIGIGWSSDGEGDRSFYFTCDIGVNFIGSGSMVVSHTGNIKEKQNGTWVDVNNSMLEDTIREEGKDFFEIADDLFVYPVIQFGFGYRF